ncbi:AAA family ATPase [Spirosoma litoris]
MQPKNNDISNDFLQLARIALTGRQQDIQLIIHRASKRLKSSYPELTDALIKLLQESPTRATPLRKQAESALPVDVDSRLQLLRVEKEQLEYDPVLPEAIQKLLDQTISERSNTSALLKHGLQPTKSLLLTGPPGVGKTLAAKWIASKLDKPLLILDLTAVMSSYLGRTGNNIRFVLDYAKNTDCVLLIDELDAIAKRRDDNSEIGELKRLVTVLLQEIDDWPSSGLLIAATNHPDLLDPAIWRRFEIVLEFSNPSQPLIEQQVNVLLKDHLINHQAWSKILSYIFVGNSFSEIERQLSLVRKSAAIDDHPLEDKLKDLVSNGTFLSKDQKLEIARNLIQHGIMSQRQAHELTGLARETIRKSMSPKK